MVRWPPKDGQPTATLPSTAHTDLTREVPNVRHERRIQAQLESVRSMEGLGAETAETATTNDAPVCNDLAKTNNPPASRRRAALRVLRKRPDRSKYSNASSNGCN